MRAQVMGIAIFSPPLDSHGNSVKGVEFCKALLRHYPYGVFDQLTQRPHHTPDSSASGSHSAISKATMHADVSKSDADAATGYMPASSPTNADAIASVVRELHSEACEVAEVMLVRAASACVHARDKCPLCELHVFVFPFGSGPSARAVV